MEIIQNHERLHEVLDTLLEGLENRTFPYDNFVLPQDRANFSAAFPYNDAREYASTLFRLCYYMRGRTDSVRAAQGLGRLHVRRPEYFKDGFASKTDPQALRQSLINAGLTALKSFVPDAWVENSKRMLALYDGDPRKIFEGVSGYEEACRRVMNDKKGGGFCGFQEKMVSMLLYFLMDAELIEFFYFPVPVDFHVLRVSVSLEIVEFSEDPIGRNVYSKELLAQLREMFQKYSESNGITPLAMAEAMWLLSNRLCKRTPGNKINEGEWRKRKTVLTPVPPTWTPAERRTQGATCGMCPVEPLCKYDIGAGPYYVDGKVVPIRLRAKPPQLSLPRT